MKGKYPYGKVVMYCILSLISGCGRTTDTEELKNTDSLFKMVSSEVSNVYFNNKIEENDRFNMVDFFYVYNGGGVAIGDLNNDGLSELYFTGNMVSDALYLNQGGLRFKNVTSALGTMTEGWSTGVSMVDINHDGLLDIYVCRSGNYKKEMRKNLLYINQGNLVFKEQAAQYNLDDDSFSTQAAFFDYDRDGDLDMYLLNHTNDMRNPNNIVALVKDGSGLANDRLYRNDEDQGEGIKFTDVTTQAGITFDGFGLGIGIADINRDGWEDIFVTNDFLANDYIYINQQDGTFKEMSSTYLGHVSHFSMGNDVADFNNDGLVDLVTVDMRPSSNYGEKKMSGALNFDLFEKSMEYGYLPQYMRNTLQVNMGAGNGNSFSEIGQLVGMDATDWSWGPLFADFDNDGFKDLFISNGYLRDITDLDFINYTSSLTDNIAPDSLDVVLKKMAREMPSIKVPNVMLKNTGDKGFINTTHEWGLEIPSLSNGAAYGDLDNDGDLDLVINNINEEAAIYENRSNALTKNNFLQIELNFDSLNTLGIGTEVKLYQGDKHQLYRQSPTRGYQSSMDHTLHVGLGRSNKVDSLLITWPNGITKKLIGPKINSTVRLDPSDGVETSISGFSANEQLFKDVSPRLGDKAKHGDALYYDFNREYLLPHKLSEQGPGIAVGDVNGDGFEDFFMGGGYNYSGMLFYGSISGDFQMQELVSNEEEKYNEDTGVLLFDFDTDGDLDLYIASGSNEFYENSQYYQDRLYINDGKGNFQLTQGVLPPLRTSNSCVRAADFDNDGDLDLFVGGRLTPLKYPIPCNSYLLENMDGKFIDVTNKKATSLRKQGMVKDALWTDFDTDGDLDLIVVGEFMAIEFYENIEGGLRSVSDKTGLTHTSGLWNSIKGGDFDNDGDVDYVLGNLGLNSRYKASKEEPLAIYALDLDKNGSIDPIMSFYRDGKEYPVHTRDDLLKQVPALKKKFPDYKSYAKASIDDVLTQQDKSSAYTLRAFNLASSLLINLGNGKFQLKELPIEAQIAPIYGMAIADYDFDGNLDMVLSGNDYGTEVSLGRYDALKGVFLKGLGNSDFSVLPHDKTGLWIDGNTRGFASINANGTLTELIGVNNGNMRSFQLIDRKDNENLLKIPSKALYAKIFLENGKSRIVEFYHGSGYLSQTTRDILLTGKETRIVVYGSGDIILFEKYFK
ncbi:MULTISPECIES: VCBS repeat-containing protein [Maribacter]|nr:VCBS repeat-containing protein [Maribacter sp. PR66]